MGGSSSSVAQKIKLEDIKQNFKLVASNQSTPNLPSYDVLQNKDGAPYFIAKTAAHGTDTSKLVQLRNSIQSRGLPELAFVQQSDSMLCGGASTTTYFEYYNDNLAVQSKRNAASKNSFRCEDIAKVAHETLKVLASMHGVGYPHQNVRPQNIMFSNESELKLLDSPLLTGVTAYSYSKQQNRPEYLSPQQYSDLVKKQANSTANKMKADVFALGLVLLQMFTERSHTAFYVEGKFDFAMLEVQLSRMSGTCSFEVVDKLRLMLKESEEERKTAARLLAMFDQMASRKSQIDRDPSSLPTFVAY